MAEKARWRLGGVPGGVRARSGTAALNQEGEGAAGFRLWALCPGAGSLLCTSGASPGDMSRPAEVWLNLEAAGTWQDGVNVRSGGRAKNKGGKANSLQEGWL